MAQEGERGPMLPILRVPPAQLRGSVHARATCWRTCTSGEPASMPAGTASALASTRGRSMLSSSPLLLPPHAAAAAACCRVTTRSPLLVSKVRLGEGLPSPKNSAAAAASVAWPQSGTSMAGVNQRRAKRGAAAKASPGHSR